MADRTINVNINITGSTTGGTGGTKVSSSIQQKEEAKRLTAQLKEEEKRRTLDHAAELKKQSEESKRAYKQQTDAAKQSAREQTASAKKAAQDQIAETRKAANANSNTWGNALKSYQFKFNALGNIISNVVSTATRMLAQLGSSVVTISKDFEFAMAGVRAITMATDKEFNQLRNDAIRLGGQTLFTSKQIAGLQEELAKLGFTVPEIRAATDGVVALAAATGEDLAQSALVAGTVIRGFGMNANELTRVVDVMAQSFNASALDLYKFQETMKYIAPVASKTGWQMEEVTAIMAKLADQGVVASQAGTGLRNIFLRLADANSKLSKAIGFTVTSLPELIIGFQKLNKEGLDATKALALADRYSVTAVLALAQQSDLVWDAYKNYILTGDAAKKMSEIRMDNFAGSIEKLTGAWESLILTINKGNGVLKVFIDLATGTLDYLQDAFGSLQGKATIMANDNLQLLKETIEKDTRLKKQSYINDAEALMDSYNNKEITQKEFSERSQSLEETYSKSYDEILSGRLDANIKATQARITIWEKEIKWWNVSRKKLLEANKIYLEDLISWQQSLQQEATKTMVDLATEEAEKKENIVYKTAQLQIDIMQDGLEKEFAIIDLHYLKLQDLAEEVGIKDINWTQKIADAKYKIVKEYENKIAKFKIDIMEDGFDKELATHELHYSELLDKAREYGIESGIIEEKMWKDRIKIIEKYYDIYKGIVLDESGNVVIQKLNAKDYVASVSEEYLKLRDLPLTEQKNFYESIKNQKLTSDERLKLLDKFIVEWKRKIEGADLEKRFVPKDEDQPKSPTFWDNLGITDLTSEQMSALKRGFTFISDQIQGLADKEKEMADLRVENSERVVDQLQRDLEIELQKMQAGYASNVTLKEKELADAKKRQAEALKLQEEAVEKQQQLEAMAQAVSLISATANILKNYSAMPVVGQILAIAEIAAMWGTFAAAQVKAKELTKYGEGGEIEGKKHSQGGVPVEAEGGEFVVRASAYAKNKDLVQAINNDDMSDVYRALNQDLSVSLDDTNTARMLGKHFNQKKVTYFNGYRVEEIGNRRRVIHAKV
jgi:TP901 family phage tail tape measure protein